MHTLKIQRYFLELSYDGTTFHGWQTQPNAISIQEHIDRALTTVFRQPIETVGCGRTDAGVHAKKFYAHFDVQGLEAEKVLKSIGNINALLPYEIAIHSVFKVEPSAHARFDATQRSYAYYIHFAKNPFLLNRSWLVKDQLNVELMNKAAGYLLNYTDFSCFSKSNTQTFTNNCTITKAVFEQQDDILIFHISADRFLRNMVRAIVGTLVQIGKGDFSTEMMHEIINSKNRSMAGQSVPACGLYLTEVKYPYINE